MCVFIVDKYNKPLMPCSEKRARQLLEKKYAIIIRRAPFVIKLLHYSPSGNITALRLKLDPGSRITGMALLSGSTIVWLGELHHRTNISNKLTYRSNARRSRRKRHTRYRADRFDNRMIPSNRIAPSLEARINQTMNAIALLRKYVPIDSISTELATFDTQKLVNPKIFGAEYQQGMLLGYELRTYVQEKFHHTCIYCGKSDYDTTGLRFEIDHIIPRSRGGSDKISNLAWSCEPCNKKKNAKTADEFGYPEIAKSTNISLKDASVVNTTKWKLLNHLKETNLDIEIGTGYHTKYNRTQLCLPKLHCIDAACVGTHVPDNTICIPKYFDIWKAMGRGKRQIMQPNSYGFPKQYRSRTKRINGFATGDIIQITGGKYVGKTGRLVASVGSPYIILSNKHLSCRYKKMKLVQKSNGWDYSKQKYPNE